MQSVSDDDDDVLHSLNEHGALLQWICYDEHHKHCPCYHYDVIISITVFLNYNSSLDNCNAVPPGSMVTQKPVKSTYFISGLHLPYEFLLPFILKQPMSGSLRAPSRSASTHSLSLFIVEYGQPNALQYQTNKKQFAEALKLELSQ